MKKFTRLLLFCFLASYFLSLASNLSAQSGWSEDQRLVFMQGAGWYPRAACSGDTIHLVWYRVGGGYDGEVYYKRSTDAGLTWGADVRLSEEDEQSSIVPIVFCNGLIVYVFWAEEDFGTLFRKSIDGGTTWGAIDSSLQGEFYRDVFIVNDTIFLAGARNPGDIIFRKSTDAGMSWLPLRVVGYGAYVRHAVSPPVIGFVFQVARYSQEIMFKRSTDNGNTWPDSMIISHYDSIGGQWAVIDVDTFSNMHAGWYDYKYSPYAWTGDIFYRTSRDSGSTWEEIDSLTIMHRAVASDILAEGDNLHLVWEDDRHGFGNNFEIYYRMSTDLGQTWGSEVRLTDALYHSYCPSLACGSGYLHLFWQDRREYGNNGSSAPLYYKRKDLSGAIAEGGRFPLNSMLKFNVYPNPFSKLMNISFGKGYSAESIEKTVGTMPIPLSLKIFDVSGKEVMVYEMKQKEREIRVDCKDLPAGVYFLQVEAGDGSVIKKVVKVR